MPAAIVAAKWVPATPPRADPGRIEATASCIRPTIAGSSPQSARRPSTWISIRPKAASDGSVVAAIPGLKAASRSRAASSAAASAAGSGSRKTASGESRWALPSGMPRRIPISAAAGLRSRTTPEVQGWPPRTIGPRGKGVECARSQRARVRRSGRWGQRRWRSLIVQDPW